MAYKETKDFLVALVQLAHRVYKDQLDYQDLPV